MVTMQVDDEVWRYLTVRKDPGDSLNDVVRRELGLDSEPDVETILSEWQPDEEVDDDRARGETRRAYEWLLEQHGRRSKSEFQSALAGDSGMNPVGWWERAVLPGLQELAERGVVEYRAGHHDYKAVE